MAPPGKYSPDFRENAFDMSDSTYGHRRIQAQPHCWGVTVGLTLVRRLMRELGLEPHR